MKKITVLIPCYNEEKGIGKVIDGVPIKKLSHLGYQTEIIVINNNSSDRTIKVALEKGAKIVSEKKQGKGKPEMLAFKINRTQSLGIYLSRHMQYKEIKQYGKNSSNYA